MELQCALQNVADSLLRYNTTRIVRDSEKSLFLAMCRAFIEVFSGPWFGLDPTCSLILVTCEFQAFLISILVAFKLGYQRNCTHLF